MKIISCFLILRPLQWTKNLILFFPPFLSGSLFSPICMSLSGLLSFISFCFVSSSVYVFNDLRDMDKDALHPVKRLRPLPSGQVSKTIAATIAFLFALLGFLIAFLVAKPLILYLLLYCFVTISYSIGLKQIPIFDLFCISSGFLIRLKAGGTIFNVDISEWLFLSVFFLSLFLSIGKRLSEQNLLGNTAVSHRTSLCGYPDGTLDATLQITAASVLVTYSMYTLAHPRLVYTVPICTFGLFRYILRVKIGNSGDPTESLFRDIPLLSVSILWALIVYWSIYL